MLCLASKQIRNEKGDVAGRAMMAIIGGIGESIDKIMVSFADIYRVKQQ